MENPKIRFKGFTKDWEQRKFSELYARSSEKNDGSIGMDKNITVATMQFKNDVKVSTTEYLKTYYTFKLGDIAFEGHQSKEFRYGRFVENDIGNGIVSHIFAVFRPIQEYDLYFWKYAINNETLMQRILARSTKASTMMHDLVTNDFLNETFLVPSVKEQKQIGAFLNKLDNLITLHQRKCEQTKKMKKYMLQKMFPQNGAKVPEIRFDGFTYDWEQRKLGDVAEFSKGNGYSKGDLIESGTPIILYGRLYTKYETIISEVDTYVEAKEGSVYSKGGEVIVPASGETAEDIARAATVDKSGILLGGDLNVVMPNKDINPAFLAISISNGNSQRELSKKAQGKSVVHIHNEEIRNLVIPFPNKVEQNKIVAYFANLDHLITLHQRKCDELKKMKKYMLQNMFI